MANRRQGYGGGRSQYYNNGPVNPWQVGNVPGGSNQGNAFNSANSSNLLSQLSEPQAQLALALTKLLQPQQHVPSLLTMNTINPLQNNGGYAPNSYNSQRGGRGDHMNRRPRPDMKRNEPYNKMNRNNNRDTDYNKRRGNSSIRNERKIQPHRTTIVSKSNKNSSTSTTKGSPKPSGKTNEVKSTTKTEDEKDANTTTSPTSNDTTENETTIKIEKSEENESDDKKRDWKEEKEKSSEDNENEDDDDNKAESQKAEDDQKSVDDKDADKPVESKKFTGPGDEKYKGIPCELLHCHICQKKMWDGESYDKHMNGRAHQQMFEKVEDSYRIKADMMRESIRLAEEKNNIEMDRMKRLGKKMKAQQLSRCAMCDLEFYGQLFIHRKSPNHQKLKRFLHPRCTYCNKEFPTRMEWENHRHTAEHLLKKTENMDRKKGNKPDDEGIMLEEECFIPIDNVESDNDSDAMIDITDEDLPDDTQICIPIYKSNREVGLSLIAPVSGFFCKPCSRFFLNDKASQQHAQSRAHYDVFVNLLNEKIAENEEKKRKKQNEDDDDNEGNWKRRKTTKEDDLEESSKCESEKNDSTIDGSAYYDPADTFTTTDPNDINLSLTKEDDSFKDEDTLNNEDEWNEVEAQIDEILETQKGEKMDGEEMKEVKKVTSTPAQTPQHKPAPKSVAQRRATRQTKKN